MSHLAPISFGRRLRRCLVGLVMCGVGYASLLGADLGLDPWDVLHQGIAEQVGQPIGRITVLVGLVVLLGWIPLRQWPGLGTVLNALIIGSVMDVVIPHLPDPDALVLRWALLAAGILVAGVGTGLYIGAGLGPGPRDGLMTGIAKRGHTIRSVRTAMELGVLVAGWLLGGSVGIGTLVAALTIGHVVHAALDHLTIDPAHPPQEPVLEGT